MASEILAPMGHGPHPAAVAATTSEARAARSEREWRLLADPAPAVEGTKAMLAEGGTRAYRFFRAGFEVSYGAYSRGDWEINTLFIDADDYTFRPAAGLEMIDAADELHGIPGYLKAQELLLDVWDDVQAELDDVVVMPPDRVVTTMLWHGRAARSGMPMEWNAVTDHHFRDGLAIAQTFWWDRARAERDLGFELPAPARRG